MTDAPKCPSCPHCGAKGEWRFVSGMMGRICGTWPHWDCGSWEDGDDRYQSDRCRIRQLENLLRQIVDKGEQYNTPDGPKIILPREVWVEATKEVKNG